MLKKKWLPFLIALIAMFNLMCGFGARDFDKDSFTKIEPEPEKMAGKYVPTKETLTLIKQVGGYDLQDISIYLYEDGTFEMQNMPDWWLAPYGESKGGVDSGKGKWDISLWKVSETTLQWWQINLEFDSGNFNSQEDSSELFYTTKDMGGDEPPYTFWFYIGDPDKGRVMIFEQVIENP